MHFRIKITDPFTVQNGFECHASFAVNKGEGGVKNPQKGAFINHVDMAGGGGFTKCPYYYISLIK